ncbi:MAG: hypothetical protein RKR03_15295 [Candidatus Competibacter sp.]|nr:hypothetical protein [Candidatus Competibacter sp.]
MAPPKKPAPPARTDVRFDFVDKLPNNVPPLEQQPTSLFPFPPPVGPAEATYYFPIRVMSKGDNATGIFFPSGFKFPNKIDVILYFHGHKAGEFSTINEYWSGKLHNIRLREDINATGKQVVLIAPTLGAAPGSGINPDMGIFANPGGADDFLAEVVEWIGKYVPQYAAKKQVPKIGAIVLAGHSGAGGILSQQVKTMRSSICEVWGFDTMYGQGSRPIVVNGKKKGEAIDVAGEWLMSAFLNNIPIEIGIASQWLPIPIPIPKLRPAAQFYFYWVGPDDPVKGRSLDLQERVRKMGLNNVTVIESATVGGKKYSWENHFGTVTVNFRRRVAAARCF